MQKHKTIAVKFKNKDGFRLSGKLEIPTEVKIRHFGIFSHCFTCSKEFFAPTRVSKALADMGIAMLRFDFMGLGDSEGDFANTTFSGNIADIMSAFDFLSSNYKKPEILVGHSMGGANMLAVANKLDNIKLVATIGSPSDPAHVLKYFNDHKKFFEKNGKIKINIAGRNYILKKSFLDDMEKCNVAIDTKEFNNGATFVFQSPDDDMVSYDNAKMIYKRATEPKFLIRMEGKSHMLDDVKDANKVADTISNWLLKANAYSF